MSLWRHLKGASKSSKNLARRHPTHHDKSFPTTVTPSLPSRFTTQRHHHELRCHPCPPNLLSKASLCHAWRSDRKIHSSLHQLR
jgi:hypothetical protein